MFQKHHPSYFFEKLTYQPILTKFVMQYPGKTRYKLKNCPPYLKTATMPPWEIRKSYFSSLDDVRDVTDSICLMQS